MANLNHRSSSLSWPSSRNIDSPAGNELLEVRDAPLQQLGNVDFNQGRHSSWSSLHCYLAFWEVFQ